MGSVLNIAGNYFEFAISQTDTIADTKAIYSDWGVIEEDINAATYEVSKEIPLENDND